MGGVALSNPMDPPVLVFSSLAPSPLLTPDTLIFVSNGGVFDALRVTPPILMARPPLRPWPPALVSGDRAAPAS